MGTRARGVPVPGLSTGIFRICFRRSVLRLAGIFALVVGVQVFIAMLISPSGVVKRTLVPDPPFCVDPPLPGNGEAEKGAPPEPGKQELVAVEQATELAKVIQRVQEDKKQESKEDGKVGGEPQAGDALDNKEHPKEKRDIVQQPTIAPDPEPVINPFPFHTLIEPKDVCADKDLYLIIYVHTAPANLKNRLSIRKTWANPEHSPHLKMRIIFAVGIWPDKPSVQEALKLESAQYGDILQESYLDSYKNLTYKGMSALKYISNNCQQARFILKTDDDIFVNIFTLLQHLQNLDKEVSPDETFLLCLVWWDNSMPVLRDKRNKWYVSKDEYKDDTYPQYCSGCAFVMSTVTAPALFEASLHTPFLWVDDAYITGVAAKKAGVKHRNFSRAYNLGFNEFAENYRNDTIEGKGQIFTHVYGMHDSPVLSLWDRIMNARRHAHAVPVKPVKDNT